MTPSSFPSAHSKVLIVDDDPVSASALQAVLENSGAELVVAQSRKEGLSKLLDEDFAVILLDVKMPEIAGVEMAKLIRARRQSERTPIIFLTAYDDEAFASRAYALGASDVLTKPLVPEALRSKVAVFVELSRLRGELERRVQDQLESQRATEHERSLLIDAARALSAAPQTTEVLSTILDFAKRFIKSDAHAVWQQSDLDGKWRLVSSVGLSEEYERSTIESLSRRSTLLTELMAFENVHEHPLLTNRAHIYSAEGIRSLLAVPLQTNGRTTGTIVFYFRSSHHFTDAEKRISSALGNLASSALATAELYERESTSRRNAERAQARAAFLAKAGEALSSSLDYEVTLGVVADLSVPFFADWCGVDILTEGGKLERLAVRHTDPAKVALADELRVRYPSREEDALQIALRTGQSLLREEITDAMLAERSRGPEHLALMQSLGLKSVLIAPLIARNRTLGVLSFVTAESGRHYATDDLAFAEELARRAALAVDNARLHQEVARSEQQLRTMADSIPQLAWMAHPDGFIFWYNQRWYDYTGTTPEQMTGWGWQAVHDPRVLPEVMERWKESLRTGAPFEMQFPLRAADGTYGWFLTRVTPVHDEESRVQRWFGTNTDITALRRMQEERA